MSEEAGVVDQALECKIKVCVRCRPLNEDERALGHASVVSCNAKENEVSVNQIIAGKRSQKKFKFDHVFGQYSSQAEVYDEAVKPVIQEVLQGYNCTVFAYGQTGTGKSHTIFGELDNPDLQGVIPRSVFQIFEQLEINKSEYSVKISALELYNEVLSDLLIDETEESKSRLRIVDDPRKGVQCTNLEEVAVHNPAQIFTILGEALKRRKTSATLLNKNSSRSHSIVTLTIHTKEVTSTGEDLLKIGKLHLVDLAGSECIGRSGAVNNRAREAGNINQSLLTLGRVITALVEHRGHVPYRDSKLTRLLQESLGGRTKTCIIATLTSSSVALEETLSTLDYAYRAKDIKNKPEVNQKMTKRVLLKEYSMEIEKLKSFLNCARDKEGVYLPTETYYNMESRLQGQDEQIKELEGALENKIKDYNNVQSLFDKSEVELEEEKKRHELVKKELDDRQKELEATNLALQEEEVKVKVKNVLLEERIKTENLLHQEAMDNLNVLQESLKHVESLHAKVERKGKVELQNLKTAENYQMKIEESLLDLQNKMGVFIDTQSVTVREMENRVAAFIRVKEKESSFLQDTFTEIKNEIKNCVSEMNDSVENKFNTLESLHSKLAKEEDQFNNLNSTEFKSCQSNIKDLLSQSNALITSLAKSNKKWEKEMKKDVEESKVLMSSINDEMKKSFLNVTKLMNESCESFKIKVTTNQSNISSFIAKEKSNSEKAALEMQIKMKEMMDLFILSQSVALDNVVEKVDSFSREVISQQDTIQNKIKSEEKNALSFLTTKESEMNVSLMNLASKSSSLISDNQIDLDKMKNTSSEVVSQLATHSDKMKNTGKERQTKRSESLSSFSQQVSAFKNEVTNQNNSVDQSIKSHIGKLSIAVTESKLSNEGHCSKEKTTLSNMLSSCVVFHREAKESVVKSNGIMKDMVEKELQSDVPTGLTPAKRENWNYVGSFSHSKHDDIVIKSFWKEEEEKKKSFIAKEEIVIEEDVKELTANTIENEENCNPLPSLSINIPQATVVSKSNLKAPEKKMKPRTPKNVLTNVNENF